MNTRRTFLKHGFAGSAIISLSGAVPNMLLRAGETAHQKRNEKILVVVQLSGGNDGLNTVIPFGDDEYYKNRFTLAIAKNNIRKIDDHVGLHPALNGFEKLLEQQQLAIVQGVGYPNPNRSHFESMDLWHTAHQDSAARSEGWLGRTVAKNFLEADLPAVHFGNGLQPLALKAKAKPAPTIQSLADFKLNVMRHQDSRKRLQPLIERGPAEPKNGLLSYVYDSSQVAIATSQRLEKIDNNKQPSFDYPGSELGRNLHVIARLIDSGLSTKIYYVTLDGFDTHSNQAAAHQGLLADLSASVTAFISQLKSQGNDDRVAVLAFSEFGRRVRENASGGTDHGTAAPVFVFGGKVKSGLIGKQPSLTELDEGDLKFAIDYRQIYATFLDQWLETDSKPILGGEFQPVCLFR